VLEVEFRMGNEELREQRRKKFEHRIQGRNPAVEKVSR
jgi:hypothetical protein